MSRIAKSGQREVLENHTYVNRVQTIIEQVKEIYND